LHVGESDGNNNESMLHVRKERCTRSSFTHTYNWTIFL